MQIPVSDGRQLAQQLSKQIRHSRECLTPVLHEEQNGAYLSRPLRKHRSSSSDFVGNRSLYDVGSFNVSMDYLKQAIQSAKLLL